MRTIKKRFQRFSINILTCCILMVISTSNVFAVATLGDIASDITTGPLQGLHHFLNGVCYIIGFAFLIVSIKKYQGYRENVSEVPLSAAIIHFIIGLVFILLPLLYYLTGVRSVLG